ncbi:MAG: hypothetical protein LBN26_06465, partial [Christensenellaceae bacterium]|nr:hypothetical protein [Christensenellaceae bacterium]
SLNLQLPLPRPLLRLNRALYLLGVFADSSNLADFIFQRVIFAVQRLPFGNLGGAFLFLLGNRR